jgi:hypothetical protein
MSQEHETEGWDRSLEDQMYPWQRSRPLSLKRALAQVEHIKNEPLKPFYRDTKGIEKTSAREIALKNRAEQTAERNLHFVVLAYRTIVDEKETENNRWIFALVRQYYGVPEGQPIPSEVKRRLKGSYQYALRRIRALELRKAKTGQGMPHYHNLTDFQKHSALIDEVKRKAKARSD